MMGKGLWGGKEEDDTLMNCLKFYKVSVFNANAIRKCPSNVAAMNVRDLEGKIGFRYWNGGLGGGSLLGAKWTVAVVATAHLGGNVTK
ncbi:Uncharacterized protein TCM_020294 [Theobroma cacao]|uniref:Uncharacterized protein n=1 Tax=Theobroma cacao TaxID=3641 RepID=A0A061EJR4_THECC|nr:Uncharacterized protein TCM_020294 [Theobroma cacao]